MKILSNAKTQSEEMVGEVKSAFEKGVEFEISIFPWRLFDLAAWR